MSDDLYNCRYLGCRYLGLRVEEEAGRFKRFGHPVSVVSLDLDNCDRVNRRPAARAAMRCCGGPPRRFTVVTRDRGDDFAIVLPNTSRAGAVANAERIKTSSESHPFEHGRMTASLGVAAPPESVTIAEELIGGAYQSVSDARRSGGNRVAVL